MKNFASTIRKITIYAMVAAISLLLLMGATNAILTLIEKRGRQAPGVMVEVHGRQMHLYTAGDGPVNVVLLSGLGTASPVIDFAPLVRQLQTRARVTVVEYPGYGWSDDTDEPRSTQRSVEELREALSKAGIAPPYLLVPHSISGLQSLYYAQAWPAEVLGIVGLEMSIPQQLHYMHIEPATFNLNKYLGMLGLVRIALRLDPALGGMPTGELTPAEYYAFNMLTNWNIGSHAIWQEINARQANFQAALAWQLPPQLPVTLVLASASVSPDAPGIAGDIWQREHEKIIAGNDHANIVIMDGDHYIHHHNASRIAALVLAMIDGAAPR